jgi:caa(3)-type oxidase subunit IV
MSDHAAAHDDVHSRGHYVKVYWILLGLLVVSILGPLVSEDMDNRMLARFIVLTTAFGIAIVKAFLVCKHFMHLNVQRPYVVYLLVTMLAFMAMLFSGVAPDVMKHEGRNWENVSAKEWVEQGMARGEVHHGSDESHGESAEHAEH